MNWWVAVVFLLFLPTGLMRSVQPTLGWFFLKFVLAYVRKQSWSAIFEWVKEDRGWLWYAGDYPIGWEKKVKVINIPVPGKKGSAKPKSGK